MLLSDGLLLIRTSCEEILVWRVAQVIAALKPHRERSETVAVCIRYCLANKDLMRYDLYRKRGLTVGPGVVENAFKLIVGNRFKMACTVGRNREPTLCSPANAASRTTAEPPSSIGEIVVTPDQKSYGTHPNLNSSLQNLASFATFPLGIPSTERSAI